ncbi:hypothetical protein VNO80_28525 [Phaseolus coccineus]|uniref:Uncharacterized protein n=1 Tax=Phaseolus coccineus TaxID=3886 RepID=A0AAN9L984_PHACN
MPRDSSLIAHHMENTMKHNLDRSIKAHSGSAYVWGFFVRQQLKMYVGICSTVKAELRGFPAIEIPSLV